MSNLGGSIFVHNAVKFDYCIEEAVRSLCALCDEVVALDAQSEDETLDILRSLEREHDHLTVHEGAEWECAPDHKRLPILANQARSLLSTEWHFMLQADEVVHESSFEHVREAIRTARAGHKTWMTKRINLFGDYNHYIKEDSTRKPCNDYPSRLGRRNIEAVGDAESLALLGRNIDWREKIVLFHYGFVRKQDVILDKVIYMQSWFFGPNSQPDPRIVRHKETTGFLNPEDIIPRSEYKPLYMEHPKFAREWVQERRALLSMRVEREAQSPITDQGENK